MSQRAKTVAALANCTCYRVTSSVFKLPAEFWDALCGIANKGPGPSIIWIDEVDSVLSKTAKVRTENVQRIWEDQTSLPNVLFMLCTNLPDKLPAAIRSRGANRIDFAPLNADAQLTIILDMFEANPDNPITMTDADWNVVRGALGEMDARAIPTLVEKVSTRPANERAEAMEAAGSSSDTIPDLRSIVLADFQAVLSSPTGTSDVKAMTDVDVLNEFSVIKELREELNLQGIPVQGEGIRRSCVLPTKRLVQMLSDDSLNKLGDTYDTSKNHYRSRTQNQPVPEQVMANLTKVLNDGFRDKQTGEPIFRIVKYGSTAPEGCGCGDECIGGFEARSRFADSYKYVDSLHLQTKRCGKRGNVNAKNPEKTQTYILGLWQIRPHSELLNATQCLVNGDGEIFDYAFIPEAEELLGRDPCLELRYPVRAHTN